MINTAIQSLNHIELNIKMINILIDSLSKNEASILRHQVEVTQPELHYDIDLDGFDTKLIVIGFSELDRFHRLVVTLSLLTYDSKHIATTEMIFLKDGTYVEGTFKTDNEYLITQPLLHFVEELRPNIALNLF